VQDSSHHRDRHQHQQLWPRDEQAHVSGVLLLPEVRVWRRGHHPPSSWSRAVEGVSVKQTETGKLQCYHMLVRSNTTHRNAFSPLNAFLLFTLLSNTYR
jgi:hypothetical protein